MLLPTLFTFRPRCPLLLLAGIVLLALQVSAQTTISGTYTGATIAGDITVATNTSATFTGNTTFTGANAMLNSNGGIYWQQIGTLSGKTVTFGNNAYLYVSGANNALTLGPATTLTGQITLYTLNTTGTSITNSGAINHTSTGYGYLYAPVFTNSGTITATAGSLELGAFPSNYTTFNSGTVTADGATTTLYVKGNVANTGTLRAQNSGVLWFQGNNPSGILGAVELATGGRVRLGGTLTNTGATLNAPSGGSFDLYGGTLTGGTVAVGALTFTSSGGYLDNAILTGDLSLPAGAYVRLINSATFTGTNLTLAANSGIYWQQVATLAAKALSFGSGSYIYLSGVNSALTLNPAATATGTLSLYPDGSAGTAITNQGTLTHTSGSGQIYAVTFTNSGTISASAGTLSLGLNSAGYNSTNTAPGSITSSGSGTNVYLRGNFANLGSLTAQNSGVLTFDGTNTTANLGSVTLATGGRVRLGGTLTNTGATLNAPSGGSFDLYGGTLTGGTVAVGALTFTSSGGYLDNAILTGDLTLPTGAYVRFLNGTAFTGANLTLAANSGIYWQQVATLAAKALSFGSGSYIYISGVNSALTLTSATTATGQIQIYHDGSTGTAITNLGTLTQTTGSGSIYARTVTNSGTFSQTGGSGSIYADTFTNSGTISATTGTLYLGYPGAGYNSTNTAPGSITSSGSGTNVYLRGNFANLGSLTAQNSGVLTFDGTNTTANLGSVTLATGGRVRLGGTLTDTGATLNAPSGGSFDLYGGTITGGTVAAGALTFTSSGGYLDGTTYTGDLTLPTGAYVRFLNGTTSTGTNLTLAANSGIYWQQVATLAAKALSFGSGAYLYVSGVNKTLTFDAATTATGSLSIYSDGSAGTAFTNAGTLTHTAGSGSIYAATFTNSGSILASAGTLYLGFPSAGYNSTNAPGGMITATGSGTTVYLRGNFSNSGTLRAQNSGQLLFDGTNTTANLGTVQIATGGRALLNGTLTNTNLTAPSGGSFELYGGTINGGTIAGGALTFTGSSGYLNNTTLTGDLSLPANTGVRLTGGSTTFTGANLTLGANSGIYWQQVATLASKALAFGSGAYLYVSGVNNALTLDLATTATGSLSIYSDGSAGTAFTNAGTLTHTAGSGSIYAATFTNSGSILASAGTLYLGFPSAGYNSTNAPGGMITATGSGTTVYLRGNFSNSGTLRAQNSGQLLFDGTNTTANLGTVQIATGGRALLNGTLTNTNLTAPSGGSFELYGGTINGGTIAAGALAFTSSAGTVSGANFLGDVTLATSAYAYITGGTTFTGANLTLGSSAYLYWQQSGTLSGKTIALAPGAAIYLSGTNRSLTLDATTTVTGNSSVYSDSSTGSAITNSGSITNSSSSTGYLWARTFANSGNITATDGNLYLGNTAAGYTFTNTAGATITADGGNLHIQAPAGNPLVNQGTINVRSGTLYTNNLLTNGATGTITGAGTINGNLTFAGGVLAPGNSAGTLTLLGNLTLSGTTTTIMELGAGSADRITGLTNLTLGGQLDIIALTQTYTSGQTWNLFSASTITGSFATINVPYTSSGWVWDTSQLATTGNLTLTTFVPVPEPSTYLLLAAGLGAIFMFSRRPRRD